MRRELDERFAAYVRDRGDHHLRVAVLLTGDWHAGEDLLQTSLAKLYRAWPRLDTTADPDAYLRRVMVNTRRSWWRTRWRQETPTAVIPESATTEDFEDRRVLGVLVRQALDRLPRQQRIVVVLRYCADLPEAEVAALLGCAAGTVKEPAMNDAEEHVRQLLVLATEDIPPGIDLLRGLRTRRTRAHARASAVLAGALAAVLVPASTAASTGEILLLK